MPVDRPLYLDHHATTPLDPRVLDAMMPFLTGTFGNAASRQHRFGQVAEDAVETARGQVAALIGAASAKEIVWTSGATESDNLALKGVAEAYRERGDHLVTTRTEHKAVLDACARLERDGFRVTYLDVDAEGFVTPEAVDAAITEQTILVSVMLANNEVGTVQPLRAIGEVTRAHGVLLHTDAVQGVGRVPFDVEADRIDLASLSAHKIYGPKGVGALYVRRRDPRVRLIAQMDGGGHERGMRSGTLNVPGIVGMGAAAALLAEEGEAEAARIGRLRDALWRRVRTELEAVTLNGPADFMRRHPGNLNVSFEAVRANDLLVAVADDLALSSGSACSSASIEPSYVMRALGADDERAAASIRIGLGRTTTADDVAFAADTLVAAVAQLRAESPLWALRQEGVDPASLEW
ncbi:MAG: IscS subfamily cysteine desulfurase [Sandaracinaceae bacterium]